MRKTGQPGIDLELAGKGEILVHIGRTAAYLLTYEPAGTPYKQDMAEYFIRAGACRFSLSESDIRASMTMELDDIKMRRQLKKKNRQHDGK